MIRTLGQFTGTIYGSLQEFAPRSKAGAGAAVALASQLGAGCSSTDLVAVGVGGAAALIGLTATAYLSVRGFHARACTNAVRRAYLESLGVIMGVDGVRVPQIVKGMMARRNKFIRLDRNSDTVLNRDLWAMPDISRELLDGVDHPYKFEIGLTVIKLLFDQPNTKSFKNLHYRTKHWTGDDEAPKHFRDELIRRLT